MGLENMNVERYDKNLLKEKRKTCLRENEREINRILQLFF